VFTCKYKIPGLEILVKGPSGKNDTMSLVFVKSGSQDVEQIKKESKGHVSKNFMA